MAMFAIVHFVRNSRTNLRKENSTSVEIDMKNGPVFPGSKVAGIMVNTSSSVVFSNINPGGVDTSCVGTIGDPSYGRPSTMIAEHNGREAKRHVAIF